MGFEPQTANKPLIDPHKRTTKVNIFMAAVVALFLLSIFGYLVWKRSHASSPPTTTMQP